MSTGTMPWRARFLAPSHALPASADRSRFLVGRAATPGADARVALFLASNTAGGESGSNAYFAVYGPPVLIACADWICENLGDVGINTTRCPSIRVIESALSLAAEDRFAAVAVQEALADALEMNAER